MEKVRIIREKMNDMEAVYKISDEGQVAFTIVPSGSDDFCFEKCGISPMIQISCTGDATSVGFAAGETRHNSELTMSMRYVSQDIVETEEEKRITTIVENADGIRAEHVLIATKDCRGLRVFSRVKNKRKSGNANDIGVCNANGTRAGNANGIGVGNANGIEAGNADCIGAGNEGGLTEDITIEAISSVNLSMLTPYTEDVGRDRLMLHRFRSRWSAEGRHEARSIEDLLLEPSWANFSVRCEKFGAIGSMPVRGFFPFAAIEDKKAGVFWALSCAISSSWQIEAVRIDKGLSVSAGLADYEFGHWRKTLKAGEMFETPEVYVTAGKCDFVNVCDRLLDVQRSKLLPHQKVTELPALFNEYCTTWGNPGEEIIGRLLPKITGKDFGYFVIDAGWYADSVKGWQDNMGDWKVAEDLFPGGIKKTVEMINASGMKAGIWFELEVVGKDSDMVDDTAHLLTRDGKVIVSGTRRFWDMRSQWVTDYLSKKVIDFLNENGFKYIKIDYNDTIGIGCDGADSPGEGLRACCNATKEFFRKIRENVPGIAIEVCSSGGHRLEPSFMECADYLSFSDAHEEKEIPVIAADLLHLVLAQKSQIWAVLRKEDALKRIAYSVCAGMYGVLCISGDVFDLTDEQWEFALKGATFYKKVSPVIVEGITERFGPFQNSNRELKDYQASVRYGKNGKALVIIHSFEHDGVQRVVVPLKGDYRIADKYEAVDHKAAITVRELVVEFEEAFDAVALLLE